jgi:hypothetical protein
VADNERLANDEVELLEGDRVPLAAQAVDAHVEVVGELVGLRVGPITPDVLDGQRMKSQRLGEERVGRFVARAEVDPNRSPCDEGCPNRVGVLRPPERFAF